MANVVHPQYIAGFEAATESIVEQLREEFSFDVTLFG